MTGHPWDLRFSDADGAPRLDGDGRPCGRSPSLADVFDRFPELAERASKLTPADVPADVLADVEVEASSPGGRVTVHMRGSQVTHIGVDEVWWDDQPAMIQAVTVTSLPAGTARRFAGGTFIQATLEFADVTIATVVAIRDAPRSQSALQPVT